MIDHGDQSLSESDHSELELLYTVSVSDIAFFKRQQWSITNYALVIEAATIAIVRLLGSIERCERWLLVVLIMATLVVGLFLVNALHTSITARRDRLKNIRAKFGSAFNHAWDVPKQKDLTIYFLGFVHVVSALLSSWLVICRL